VLPQTPSWFQRGLFVAGGEWMGGLGGGGRGEGMGKGVMGKGGERGKLGE